MDYSHILTNMHNHISRNGYAFCPKEHYEQLVNEQPDILSRSIVINRIDMQNIFMAKKFFQAQLPNIWKTVVSVNQPNSLTW